jgi:uncharacterized membrane protein HdeD (DUF308 family)
MKMRSRRVGTLTLGLSLILAGVLFLLHLFQPLAISYLFIFRLWPVILIFLGIEVLAAYLVNKKEKLLYDGWAVFLMILLMFLAAAMAGSQILLDQGFFRGVIQF